MPLLAAKAALKLTTLLQRLDRYRVVILDDLRYVQQSREEMEEPLPGQAIYSSVGRGELWGRLSIPR